VAQAVGRPLDQALQSLEALSPSRLRLELVTLPNGAYLLRDEFKSTLESIDAALDLLAEIPAERKIVVLGNISEPPGSQGPIYRRLGRRIGQIASRAVIVVHKRNFQPYASGARETGLPKSALVHVGNDLLAASAAVASDLRPGDVVLVKGRDTQRLHRVSLTLMGRQVRCLIPFCDVKQFHCDRCPMLERGWDGRRVVI
jgi:UDP-N-acetylmuramoyl-tripeptide--D-alanyl-D-alanine ligase